MKEVKIILNPTPEVWYHNMVGIIFEVIEYPNEGGNYREAHSKRTIYKAHCEDHVKEIELAKNQLQREIEIHEMRMKHIKELHDQEMKHIKEMHECNMKRF